MNSSISVPSSRERTHIDLAAGRKTLHHRELPADFQWLSAPAGQGVASPASYLTKLSNGIPLMQPSEAQVRWLRDRMRQTATSSLFEWQFGQGTFSPLLAAIRQWVDSDWNPSHWTPAPHTRIANPSKAWLHRSSRSMGMSAIPRLRTSTIPVMLATVVRLKTEETSMMPHPAAAGCAAGTMRSGIRGSQGPKTKM
jgi:hypothetical protein